MSAAQDPVAANFLVNTGSLSLPTAAPGDPLWIDGYLTPFGAAPPDFLAPACSPNRAYRPPWRSAWTGTGTAAPFATLTDTGLTIDLTNAAFGSGQLRIGAETVDITTLSATPSIVPAVAVPAATSGLPLFTPLFSVGPGAISEASTGSVQSLQ